MLCTDTVEAEVGMEVSVDQEFSEELKDNTSEAYREFSNLFRVQVRGEEREHRVFSWSSAWVLGCPQARSSDVSSGILGISGEEDLRKRAGVPRCGDPVPEVGGHLEDVVAALKGGKGCEERPGKPPSTSGTITFLEDRGGRNYSGGLFVIIIGGHFSA